MNYPHTWDCPTAVQNTLVGCIRSAGHRLPNLCPRGWIIIDCFNGYFSI